MLASFGLQSLGGHGRFEELIKCPNKGGKRDQKVWVKQAHEPLQNRPPTSYASNQVNKVKVGAWLFYSTVDTNFMIIYIGKGRGLEFK